MRPLLKYLLGLIALLTLGQGMLARGVQVEAAPRLINSLTTTMGIVPKIHTDLRVPYVFHAHNAALGFSLLEAIELAEEDDKWNVNAFQDQQDDYRPLALWLALTDYHIYNHPQFTSSPTSAQGFPPTVSSCLTFCVLRI